MQPHHLYVIAHVRGRVTDGKLREQKLELLVVCPGHRGLHVVRQIPEPTLERPERLLARLVEELLVCVGGFALFLRILPQPLVNLLPERRRQVIEQHVLEVGGEVNLCRLGRREIVERRVGQRG